ncbi:molybdopterin oxidoreductase family protein [Thermococcus pacificus]|uniref:Formate dehydrogenase n=1 Tax=Thermococcus pacificus TaxID=71998 RepID=A0A218P884_9EURY|nr:molybdopterin-dependent oxidoreductase [Thermococcus pacificus]ASJ06997.1 hypothetical protein A3L08_06500 [Thermococcus pacificus]
MRTIVTCFHCGIGCRVEVKKKRSRPHEINYLRDLNVPNYYGKLCSRGNLMFEPTVENKRIKRPMKALEEGKFVEISWADALREVSFQLSRYARDDPSMLGFIGGETVSNESAYLFQKLARLLGTNNIDTTASLSQGVLIRPVLDMGAWEHWADFADIDGADLIIVWGADLARNYPVLLGRIARARERGARVVLVDPVNGRASKFADFYLRPLPGTDVFLALSIMNYLVKTDERFGAVLPEDVLKLVSRSPPSYGEELTGVQERDIKAVAHEILRSSGGIILLGSGAVMNENGASFVRAIITLAFVSGMKFLPISRYGNSQGVLDMGLLPDLLPGYTPYSEGRDFQKAWLVEGLNPNPGKSLAEMLDGGINVFYLLGADLIRHIPGALDALRNAEFIIMQDSFMTETAKFADIIFPSALLYEEGGSTTNSERRVLWCEKAKRPPGEARGAVSILGEVGKAINLPGFNYTFPEEVLREISLLIPDYPGPRELVGSPEGALLKRPNGVKRKFVPLIPAKHPEGEVLLIRGHSGRFMPELLAGKMGETDVVLISPEDASRLGVSNGDRISIEVDGNRITVRAKVSNRTLKGVAVVHWDLVRAALPAKSSENCLVSRIYPCRIRGDEM